LKDLSAEKDGPLILKLQPCGSFSGRIVDQDRQPAAGLRLHVRTRDALGGIRHFTTDAQGHFRVDGLVPGLKCYVGYVSQDTEEFLGNELVESGKNKDLGDLKLPN